MMSQQAGMPTSSFQRRQQGQGIGENSNSNDEAKASTTANTNTNLISSASYHSGMRPASMHRTLQQETIDEHSQEATHGMKSGLIRSMGALALTIYIIVCMVTKQGFITG